jgi:hypothetical protein
MESLASFLISEVHALERGTEHARKIAKEHVPGERIKDPSALAREFRWRVRLASGYASDDEGHGRRKAKVHSAAVAEVAVNGTNGHVHGKRKRESPAGVASAVTATTSSGMEDSQPRAIFKNFKPKTWDLEEEVKGEVQVRTTVAPQPIEGDEWAAAWADWKEDWEGSEGATQVEVHARRDVLVRTRRTAKGLERQRIERVSEEWVWGDEEMKVDSTSIVPPDVKEEQSTPISGDNGGTDAMETGL